MYVTSFLVHYPSLCTVWILCESLSVPSHSLSLWTSLIHFTFPCPTSLPLYLISARSLPSFFFCPRQHTPCSLTHSLTHLLLTFPPFLFTFSPSFWSLLFSYNSRPACLFICSLFISTSFLALYYLPFLAIYYLYLNPLIIQP